MTFRDFLLTETGSNFKKAKKIQILAKDKAKENNPGETEDRAGWAVDPHQGAGGNNPRMSR